MMKDAYISGHHRYSLYRAWFSGSGEVVFIMLNPSTADHETDDPTIRRCIGFAQSWGFQSLRVINLLSRRATDPQELRGLHSTQLIGPDFWIEAERAIRFADLVIAGWGAHGAEYIGAVRAMTKTVAHYGKVLHCLDTTKDGHPRHPLYLKKTLKPKVWERNL